MQFISQYHINESYLSYGWFHLAVSARAWCGKKYANREDNLPFVQELQTLNTFFVTVFKSHIHTDVNIHILADPSFWLYSHELTSVERVIQEYEKDSEISTEKIQKLTRKIRNFLHQPEHFATLLGFALRSNTLDISKEIIQTIQDKFRKTDVKVMNTVIRKELQIPQKAISLQSILASTQDQDLYDQFENIMYKKIEADNDYLSKIFKYAAASPQQLIYSLLVLNWYLKNKSVKFEAEEGYFIHLRRRQKGTDVYLDESNSKKNQGYLKLEQFSGHLDAKTRNIRTDVYSFDHMQLTEEEQRFAHAENKIEVLKALAQWAASRIHWDSLQYLPDHTDWFHFVKGDFFENMDIRHLTLLTGEKVPGATDNEEVAFFVHATSKELEVTFFTLFSPESWEGLNLKQCAIQTYAICLLHDICVEKNFVLVEHEYEHFDFELLTNEPEVKIPSSQRSAEQKKEEKETRKKRKSDWVSFHFRKLRKSEFAPEESQKRASKYGIKHIPKGYTFVESFTRGEQTPEDVRISALETLTRTLFRLEKQDTL